MNENDEKAARRPVTAGTTGRRLTPWPGGHGPFAVLAVRDDLGDLTEAGPEEALLYGRPEFGQWCTVRLGGMTLSPRRPLRRAPRRLRPFVPRAARPPRGVPPELWTSRLTVAMGVTALVGAIVAGIELRTELLTLLLDLVCTRDGCQPALLATAGWALVGVPIVVICAVDASGRAGRVALGIHLVALTLLTAGLTVMLPDDADSDAGRKAAVLQAERPEVAMLTPGFAAAIVALLIGVAVGRGLRSAGSRRRAAVTSGSTVAFRLATVLRRPGGIIMVAQVAAFVVVLAWALVDGQPPGSG